MNEAGCVACQEGDNPADFVWLADATHGALCVERFDLAVVIVIVSV
jgi:hypothetical protein